MNYSGHIGSHHLALLIWLCAVLVGLADPSGAQQISEEALREAIVRSGLSREELLQEIRRRQAEGTGGEIPTQAPGRVDLDGIDDSRPDSPEVMLPFDQDPAVSLQTSEARAGALQQSRQAELEAERVGIFGADFFRLEPGVFNPTTFGPVPDDYLIGVGDQIVVDVWGEVEFRLERIVDRDGSIILPRGGKISCHNRTLAQLKRAVRERLSRSYSGIGLSPGQGTTFVDVSLGSLRAIRVFVVGDAVQPGAYELSSVATVFTALHAAGGPSGAGSLRNVRLVRGRDTAARLDVYDYLLAGERTGDAILRDGDTVFIPPRGPTVQLRGEVRRALLFELKQDEGLAELLRFGGGFTSEAATEVAHIERILPPGQRRPQMPDRTYLDIELDPISGRPRVAQSAALKDGDVVTIGTIADRLLNWVEITGNVKRPSRYEFRQGMDVAELIRRAGGLWPDTLQERAYIDRTSPDEERSTFDFALGDVLAGLAEPVILQPRDVLRILSRWDVADRYEVTISGQVRNPRQFEYRQGMTLRDLILRADGLKESADVLKAEVARIRERAVGSRDISEPPERTVEIIEVPLGADYLVATQAFALMAHDHVAIRKLPWWELQRTVVLQGEVYYPGVYSLERPDERVSEIIERAGGLKPTANAQGARIMRSKGEIGNIALDLVRSLAKPGSAHDIVLQPGDEIWVPEALHTVKIVGAVGSPTSIVFQKGQSLGGYVDRAGGYADQADKWKTRVVYPNGLSRPIKRIWRDPGVQPGSTIVVPLKSPKEQDNTLETVREIASIMASLATVYLVIDRTTN